MEFLYERVRNTCSVGPVIKSTVNYCKNDEVTVNRPVCFGVRHPSGAHDQIFAFCLTVAGFLMWRALSDERMGL
jgi:hypothetical protein